MNTTCHICKLALNTTFDACPQCATNLADPSAESIVLSSDKPTMLPEDRMFETPIVLILTNTRLLMINKEETKKPGSGLVGGAIGGAIAGAKAALAEDTLQVRDCVSISLDNIATLETKGLGLIKIFFLFTITTKDGSKHLTAMHKKIAPEWETEIRKRIAG